MGESLDGRVALVTGGEFLLRTLQQAGVETIFGLHGAHIDSIFQACLDHGVPILDTRHEVAAGHAAEGYARAGNRLGVAMVTAGPGFTNVITSLANAYLDRTPVLYISGAAGLAQSEMGKDRRPLHARQRPIIESDPGQIGRRQAPQRNASGRRNGGAPGVIEVPA